MRTLAILVALLLPAGASHKLPLLVWVQQVKIKHGHVTDKSKPVRRALEAWYQRNMAAFAAKDVPAIMALRTDDFHTLTPDGQTHTRAQMETRTIGFLHGTDHFVSQQNDIGTIELSTGCFPAAQSSQRPNDSAACNASMQWASADVHQHVIRVARLPDGNLHTVEASVTQRETWRLTPDGWKLYMVDNIRDGPLLVDGQPRESGKPAPTGKTK